MLGLQPLVLGELVDQQVITVGGVGIVAMGEIFALGVGVALSDALLPVSRHGLITTIAAVVTAGVDLATLRAAGDNEFVLLRAASGLAEGVLLWSTTSVIVRSSSPERLAAIFMVVQTVAQAGVAALLAGVVIPRKSWQGCFEVLAALTCMCAVLATWLPPRLLPLQAHASEKLRWSAARVLPLVIALLQMSAIGALWAYIELLAQAVGLDVQRAQFMTSGVLVMQIAGGLAATWGVQRFASVPTLASVSAVLAIVGGGIYFLPAGETTVFTLLCAVFGFTWLFMMPFQIGLAFRADTKGQVAVLIPAAQLVGSALGPLLGSLAVSGNDAQAVPLVSMGFALGAAILVVTQRRRWAKTDTAESKGAPALD
jgi:predicted MFS family arabinose efflux permease